MTSMLLINASPNPESSVTRDMTAHFSKLWLQANPGSEISSRDVGLNPPPHLDQGTIGAYYTPHDARTDDQKDQLELSDTIVEEVMDADVIVIGSPMHNFGISSGLKTWIDHLARVGVTFSYTENGPQGHLSGRKVYVLTARGGNYSKDSPATNMNIQEPYLRTLLGFLGLDDVQFINAEGVAGGMDGRDKALSDIATVITREAA